MKKKKIKITYEYEKRSTPTGNTERHKYQNSIPYSPTIRYYTIQFSRSCGVGRRNRCDNIVSHVITYYRDLLRGSVFKSWKIAVVDRFCTGRIHCFHIVIPVIYRKYQTIKVCVRRKCIIQRSMKTIRMRINNNRVSAFDDDNVRMFATLQH